MQPPLLTKHNQNGFRRRSIWTGGEIHFGWADVSNRYLERAGQEERVDHRSNAARGLDEIPTIHEGVTARAREKKGIISNRCALNRQIKADNALRRQRSTSGTEIRCAQADGCGEKYYSCSCRSNGKAA